MPDGPNDLQELWPLLQLWVNVSAFAKMTQNRDGPRIIPVSRSFLPCPCTMRSFHFILAVIVNKGGFLYFDADWNSWTLAFCGLKCAPSMRGADLCNLCIAGNVDVLAYRAQFVMSSSALELSMRFVKWSYCRSSVVSNETLSWPA